MAVTEVRLLGPVEVALDGRPVGLGGAKVRAVLAMLALHPNRVVSVDALIEGLWGMHAPPTANKLVQHYVSQLRKRLADGDVEIVTRRGGYELRARPEAVDVAAFERLAAKTTNGSAARAALDLWRGAPLLDLADEPFAGAEARRLEELWLDVTQRVLAADCYAGRHAEVLATLDRLLPRHPLHERLHGLRMRALYLAGRQADALDAFRDARATLVGELGLEPGPELRELHQAILRQDAELVPPRPAPPRPPPPARRGRRSRRAPLVTALLALVAGGAAFGVSRVVAPDRLPGLPSNAVGRIDANGDLLARYTLGRRPSALAVGGGAVWVADAGDGTVSRLEPRRNRVTTIPVGSDPVAVAWGDRSLWVAERGDRTIAQVNPVSNRVVQRVETANAPSALAVGFGSVWVGSAVDQALTRVMPDGATRAIPLGARPTAVATGAGAVWVTSEEDGSLFRIDPRSITVVRTLRLGNRPVAVVAGGGGVWVACRQDGTVWRVDPARGVVTDTVAVGGEPSALALSGDDVWVARADGRVARIDGATRRVDLTRDVGSTPIALGEANDGLWLATEASPTQHRGGTVTVATEPYPLRRLDPATYDAQTHTLISLVYDGLLGYRRTGGTTFGPLVANLAARVPEPSADKRTYVFELRPDVRFSNGEPVEPRDVRASVEALLRAHGGEIDAFDAVVGARACARRPRTCDLSAGIATDARGRTVTIRLERPDPLLLHRFAQPLASVTPADAPFGSRQPPPGTGPYRIATFDGRRGADLTRNPHFRVWAADARPQALADRIRFRVREDAAGGLRAIERGTADVVTLADAFGTGVPPRVIRGLLTRAPDRLRTVATPSLFYLWMDVRTAPFDDVRARRALNFALDRTAIARLEGGEPIASPACGFVAPGHPGYAPGCPYRADPAWTPRTALARALVRRSGTSGARVAVAVPAPERPVGRYLTGLLKRLGYRPRLTVLPEYGAYREHLAEAGAHVGTDGWAADVPTAADFATPWSCEGREGSPFNANLAGFCDRRFERGARAGGGAADARWREAYRRLSAASPGAPLVNRRGIVFTSARLGGYQHHPLYGVLLDRAWVR